MTPIVIAHRTCPRDAPENSLEGIAAAAAAGSDLVEVDVRRARDGVPVLMHDRWLLRTTWRPMRVDWLDSDRVSRLGLRGGGTVPTLAEALAALGPTMGVALDVKDPGAGVAVVAEVRNQGLEDRTLFWSQHREAIDAATAAGTSMQISLLRDTAGDAELDRFIDDATSVGASGISAHWSVVDEALAERCAGLGITLYSWCKSRDIDAGRLRLVDGVVTDWPQLAHAAIGQLGSDG